MATKRADATTKEARNADRVVTANRRALHEFSIAESAEAGIELTGTEIKSIRAGKVSISEAYARIDDGELWLVGAHISPYTHGSYTNHDPDRRRKLLVHKSQIRELRAQVEQRGMTLVPLRVALRKGRAKIDIGVARGKELWDKRAASSERDANREIARAMREVNEEIFLMIEHIVLLKPRAEIEPAAITALWTGITGLKATIPGIESIEVGENTSPEGLDRGFALGFVVRFTDAAARDAYLPHPDHVAVVPLVRAVAAEVLVFDLSVGG